MKKSKKDPQRITKIKRFINKYKCEGIHFPSEKNDWKKFEKNNVTIAINVCMLKIYPAYVSKHNSNYALSCSKKIISVIKRSNIKK